MKGKYVVGTIILFVVLAMILTWFWLQDVIGNMPK